MGSRRPLTDRSTDLPLVPLALAAPPHAAGALVLGTEFAARNGALEAEVNELRGERDRALALSAGLRQELHFVRNEANRYMLEAMRLRRELARLSGEPASI